MPFNGAYFVLVESKIHSLKRIQLDQCFQIELRIRLSDLLNNTFGEKLINK